MAKTKEESLATARAWKVRNAHRVRESRKAYYAANREKAIEDNKIWIKANPEKRKEYQRNGYYSEAGEKRRAWERRDYAINPIKQLIRAAKARSRRDKVPFNLTVDDLTMPTHCPLLGILISKGDRGPHDGSPSIDRIVPGLGYVRENVWIISHKANRIKSNATFAEVEKLYTAWESIRKTRSRMEDSIDNE